MAELSGSIFNQKASDKLRSPDDLDKYVRVSNPSGWIVFAASAALAFGLLSWGLFGTVSTSVNTTGVIIGGTPMCFLSTDDYDQVVKGDVATFGGQRMKVASVAKVPMSRNEANAVIKNDYLNSTLIQDDWEYQVIFEGDVSGLANGVPLNVNITTERTAPVELLIKGKR